MPSALSGYWLPSLCVALALLVLVTPARRRARYGERGRRSSIALGVLMLALVATAIGGWGLRGVAPLGASDWSLRSRARGVPVDLGRVIPAHPGASCNPPATTLDLGEVTATRSLERSAAHRGSTHARRDARGIVDFASGYLFRRAEYPFAGVLGRDAFRETADLNAIEADELAVATAVLETGVMSRLFVATSARPGVAEAWQHWAEFARDRGVKVCFVDPPGVSGSRQTLHVRAIRDAELDPRRQRLQFWAHIEGPVPDAPPDRVVGFALETISGRAFELEHELPLDEMTSRLTHFCVGRCAGVRGAHLEADALASLGSVTTIRAADPAWSHVHGSVRHRADNECTRVEAAEASPEPVRRVVELAREQLGCVAPAGAGPRVIVRELRPGVVVAGPSTHAAAHFPTSGGPGEPARLEHHRGPRQSIASWSGVGPRVTSQTRIYGPVLRAEVTPILTAGESVWSFRWTHADGAQSVVWNLPEATMAERMHEPVALALRTYSRWAVHTAADRAVPEDPGAEHRYTSADQLPLGTLRRAHAIEFESETYSPFDVLSGLAALAFLFIASFRGYRRWSFR